MDIGDDAAVLPGGKNRQTVISTDLLVENVHFHTATASFKDIGFKAAVANLSDMAAMGAQPHSILIALAVPTATKRPDLHNLYQGLALPCRPYQVRLIGGDTSRSPSLIFVGITILGDVEPDRYLTRHGAKVGDLVYVSGTLGDSAAGLHYLSHSSTTRKRSTTIRQLVNRHLRPTPRIALGRVLAKERLATAALDISDGLSGDLSHLCEQSGVGALLYTANIPLSSSLKSYAQQNQQPALEWALHGGEDYELLFTIPQQNERRLLNQIKRLKVPITCIGSIKPRRHGIKIELHEGKRHPLEIRSFSHF